MKVSGKGVKTIVCTYVVLLLLLLFPFPYFPFTYVSKTVRLHLVCTFPKKMGCCGAAAVVLNRDLHKYLHNSHNANTKTRTEKERPPTHSTSQFAYIVQSRKICA